MNLCIDYKWGGFFLVFFRSRGQTLLAASLKVSRAPVQDDDEEYFDDDNDGGNDDDDVGDNGNEEVQITFSAES